MPTEASIAGRLKLRTSSGEEVERLPDPPRADDDKPEPKPAPKRGRPKAK